LLSWPSSFSLDTHCTSTRLPWESRLPLAILHPEPQHPPQTRQTQRQILLVDIRRRPPGGFAVMGGFVAEGFEHVHVAADPVGEAVVGEALDLLRQLEVLADPEQIIDDELEQAASGEADVEGARVLGGQEMADVVEELVGVGGGAGGGAVEEFEDVAAQVL